MEWSLPSEQRMRCDWAPPRMRRICSMARSIVVIVRIRNGRGEGKNFHFGTVPFQNESLHAGAGRLQDGQPCGHETQRRPYKPYTKHRREAYGHRMGERKKGLR